MMSNPFFKFDQRFELPPLASGTKPVFILSSTWRSGSTLLQRSLCTDPSIMVWGEPYADCNLIPSMMLSAKGLLQDNWPTPQNFAWGNQEVFKNPHQHFIANIYPGPSYIRGAFRQFLDLLFLESAKSKGFSRFGAKFVRLSIEEAYFLQWIYPDAIFLFLVRNPWDCWRSYKGYSWRYRYPKPIVRKVEHFSTIWTKQTMELLTFKGGNVGWIRYEDFLQDSYDWEKLKAFCELPNMTKEALGKKIMGIDRPPSPLKDEDIQAVSLICSTLANSLGYFGLANTDLSVNPF